MNAEEFTKKIAAMIAERDERHAAQVLELRGKIEELQKQVAAIPPVRDGRDGLPGVPGPPGQPGKDATLSVADLPQPEFDGERTVTWMGKEIRLPILIYRGIYTPGADYEAEDAVTYGGSVWRCKTATSAKPGDGSPDWMLIVKAGRDGRDNRGSNAQAAQAV